jgi:hypothetical protein
MCFNDSSIIGSLDKDKGRGLPGIPAELETPVVITYSSKLNRVFF